MDLTDYIVLVTGVDDAGPWLHKKDEQDQLEKDFREEYPNMIFASANEFENKEELSEAIMQMISSDLENANYHSINGIQDTIYTELVKRGVNKFDAAEAIYEGFRNL